MSQAPLAAPPLAQLFRRPLVDLGDQGGDRWRGIYSPIYDQAVITKFMTDHYESQEGADKQDKTFDLTGYYEGLLTRAFADCRVPQFTSQARVVLELGCGFGSATWPLLKLLPQATVIASELSVAMLTVLKRKLAGRPEASRCLLLQLNAEDLDFHGETVDLVAGAAILHHLFQPEIVLSQCARLLKPGGMAIFFEPFENGYGLMSLLYQAILNDPRLGALSRAQRAYFEHCLYVWRNMRNPDKTAAYFQGIDDKWLFTRTYFQDLARKHGLEPCLVNALDQSATPFANLAKTHFDGNQVGKLPDWVWAHIRRGDEGFTAPCRQDLLTEGCIIFHKPA